MRPNRVRTSQDELASRAWNLADLIAYQKGSVVSRTIIDRKAGTVTLFAFDAGQGLSEHTAPFDALIQVITGVAEAVMSDKALRLNAGEIIILPANKPHAIRAVKRFKMLLTMVKSTGRRR
jgi:quercetin dioxygenase-like cupin family protein